MVIFEAGHIGFKKATAMYCACQNNTDQKVITLEVTNPFVKGI